MVLVIDNYDSFVFNLVQYLGELGREVRVVRNDRTTVEEIARLCPAALVVSPGPGRPENAGIIVQAIRDLAGRIPILGVCLGHQAIGSAFGAGVVSAPEIMHGKASGVLHDGRTIYAGMPNPFRAGRYHSLVVSDAGLPDCLQVSARTAEGLIMGLRHRRYLIEGVQFHPESILTDGGRRIIANFLSLAASGACSPGI